MIIDLYPEKHMWHCRNRISVGFFDFQPELFLYKGRSEVYKAVLLIGGTEFQINFKGRGQTIEQIAFTCLGQAGRGRLGKKWNKIRDRRLPA